MRATIRRFLWRLVPDEPLFPFPVGEIPEFSEEMPVSVKYWCFVTIAINVLALGIGGLISRDFTTTLTLFFAFTSFFPINALLTWRYTMRQLNRIPDSPMRFLVPFPIFMSFEWIYITMLIGASGMLVSLIFAR
jgi:hypothetical protein